MGDVFRSIAVFRDTATSKPFTTHLDMEQQPLGGAPGIDDVEAAWVSWWDDDHGLGDAGMKTYYGAAVSLEKVTLQRIKTLEPLVFESSLSLPIAGTSGNQDYAPGSALLISLRTPFAGRSYRGRVYLRSPDEVEMGNDGLISNAAALVIQAQFQWLVDELSPDFYKVVVFSKVLNEAENVTAIHVDRRARSQRRRQVRAPLYAA